jgi:hypothetical protein
MGGQGATSSGVKLVKRFGYATKTEAEVAAQHAGKLLGLATDETTRKRIGDMMVTAKRGAPLPSAEDVARRIGVGLDRRPPGSARERRGTPGWPARSGCAHPRPSGWR